MPPDEDTGFGPDDEAAPLRDALAAKGWQLGEVIGEAPAPGSVCDADTPSVYQRPDGTTVCRCVVCPRCHHHTGNSHQGHFWGACRALAERLTAEEARTGECAPFAEWVRKTTREPHFCCPDPAYGCSLEAKTGEPG